MTALNNQAASPARRIRRRGRESQVRIYLGKQLRFFVNESDWKVLPMSAIIAGLVCMVMRRQFFQNMEGDLFGSFALTCVCIWNGCFNSIQSVCRERPIVKREHRSGMHISSYMAAHMIYQLMLCVLQTVISLVMMYVLGDFTDASQPAMVSLRDHLTGPGFMTRWMMLDLGITMLLITYASDMMSLLISSIAHTTTGAMTVMPFVLIFQLVFSGGIIPLPAWSKPLSNYTISNYGIKAICAQTGFNEAPMVTGWKTLDGMRDKEIRGTVTLGEVLDFIGDPAVEKYRDRVILPAATGRERAEQVMSFLKLDSGSEELSGVLFADDGQYLAVTLGEVIDFVRGSEALNKRRDMSVSYRFTVGELMEMVGEARVRDIVQTTTANANQKAEYTRSVRNITGNWAMLGLFVLCFAFLATLIMEMIDRDRR